METQTKSIVTAAAAGAPRGGVLARRTRVVLPRRAVMFRVFDLPGVPLSRRAGALRLAIAEWSPYPEWSAVAVWSAATAAAVWVANREEGELAQARSWLPESLLLASDARPVEVIRGQEGWIVRRWLDGRLAAEHFYPARPDAAQWSSTMAGLGVSDADSRDGWNRLIDAQPATLLAKPWADRVEHIDAGSPVRRLDLRRLLIGAGAALALATLALALVSARHWFVEGSLDASLADARERLAPVAEQRTQALDVAQKLQAWNDLDRYPAPLDILDAFAESVPPGVVVSELRIDAGVLRATLSNPGIQPAADLVTKLQKSGRFANVRVVPAQDPSALQVEMELTRRPAAPKAKNAA